MDGVLLRIVEGGVAIEHEILVVPDWFFKVLQ